ncbi:phage integrase family protein [Vibrio anguillarum]|uniref:Phage integrase family protein n=2 Tax=Vibrio anguillarum TaxID=55601 RepID=A0ABR9Z6S7_VIBAN|nr:tyrosine-type recombinase/integrase [Vibrio anguillarum]MBF4374148.1 phage integrase family protein [Vibrio anguillarum]
MECQCVSLDDSQHIAFRNELYNLYPHDEHPKYLLASEIRALVRLPTIKENHRMLMLFLFNTGARISEALAVTPLDMKSLNGRMGVRLKTLKHQREKPIGTPKEGYTRTVPLFDRDFETALSRYVNTHCSNKKKPLFSGITRQAARNWIKEIEQAGKAADLHFPLSISPKVLRHSFAIHLILHQVSVKKVQSLLGHRYASSTDIYTRLLSCDIDLDYEIQF